MFLNSLCFSSATSLNFSLGSRAKAQGPVVKAVEAPMGPGLNHSGPVPRNLISLAAISLSLSLLNSGQVLVSTYPKSIRFLIESETLKIQVDFETTASYVCVQCLLVVFYSYLQLAMRYILLSYF